MPKKNGTDPEQGTAKRRYWGHVIPKKKFGENATILQKYLQLERSLKNLPRRCCCNQEFDIQTFIYHCCFCKKCQNEGLDFCFKL